MAQSVREFFDGLEARIDPARAGDLNNSYLFDVSGAGSWLVDAKGGQVSVQEGGGEADCTISVSEENFEKMLDGQLNPMTAYMTGKLKVKGDMGAAMKLQKLF